MLMGGRLGSILWVNTEEALPIVVLDKEDKRCRQICSTYFAPILFFHYIAFKEYCLKIEVSLICKWKIVSIVFFFTE